jgi:hypothetical protein
MTTYSVHYKPRGRGEQVSFVKAPSAEEAKAEVRIAYAEVGIRVKIVTARKVHA